MSFDRSRFGRRARVTETAGLIGSHVADLLFKEGWSVRAFDNLERQTHPNGRPRWTYPEGELSYEFLKGDRRARAQVEAALDGRAVNVGSGQGVTIERVAALVSEALGVELAPQFNGEFRPGEIRHLVSDTTVTRAAGYVPQVALREGIERYLGWIRNQGSIRDYFTEAEPILRAKGILQRVRQVHRH